jgi:hypothetical protein
VTNEVTLPSADRELVTVAINDAVAAGGGERKGTKVLIELAKALVGMGDRAAARGYYAAAIEQYRYAWSLAQMVLR